MVNEAVVGGNVSEMSSLELSVRAILRPRIFREYLLAELADDRDSLAGAPGLCNICPIALFLESYLIKHGYTQDVIAITVGDQLLEVATYDDSVTLDLTSGQYEWLGVYVGDVDMCPHKLLTWRDETAWMTMLTALSVLDGVLFEDGEYHGR